MDKKCNFKNITLSTIEGPTTTPRVVGGNMHCGCISDHDQVSLYSAIEVPNKALSHVGEYVSYKEDEDEV